MVIQSADDMTTHPSDISIAAMLKAAIDDGKDYIEMCAPVLMGAIEESGLTDFSGRDLKRLLSEKLSADLPQSVTETIANRCARRGYLKREAGRWASTGKTPFQGSRKQAIEEEWARFVGEFVTYVRARNIEFDPLRAEEALLASIKENRIGLVLNDATGSPMGKAESLSPTERALVGKFFADRVLQDRALQEAIVPIVSGLVLRSTLFLGDSISAPKRLDRLTVFLDSKLAFALLGIGDEHDCHAVQQGALLLRRDGATLRIFDKSLDEMRRVLAVYQDHLGTAQGIRSLFKTSLTSYFLKIKATPGDVAVLSATLERKLRDLDVRVLETPRRVPALTLDEKALEEKLSNKTIESGAVEKRVIHDVDCVAGVLTLRRGKARDRIEDCGFIFSTLSWLTAKNISDWYRADQGARGYSPCANQSVLTTLSWLHNPVAGEDWVKAGIGSIATLASTVSEAAWTKFKRHLKKMTEEGGISNDEELALLASGFSESVIIDEALSRGDNPDEPDAATIADAVERVRALERQGIARAENDLAEIRTQNAAREGRRLVFAERVGNGVAWFIVAVALLVSLIGLIASIPADGSRSSKAAIVFYGLIGLTAVFLGGDMKGWRNSAKNWFAGKTLQALP